MKPLPPDAEVARALWHRLESMNAVTYFSPECLEAQQRLGMKGFWMGYFAARSAPLGSVPPSVVEAAFVNFHRDRVRRALPDAWSHAAPSQVLDARAASAAAALRRLVGVHPVETLAHTVAPVLQRVIDDAVAIGRPLFAANREVRTADDPVAALWQAATTLREHRGDGHVAALTAAGLDGCEVLVLFTAATGTDADLFRQSRGWNGEEWLAATERLCSRGLLHEDRGLTDPGRRLHDDIERRTDELAVAPYSRLGAAAVDHLLRALTPAARAIGASGDIAFPNPMGLPRIDGAATPGAVG